MPRRRSRRLGSRALLAALALVAALWWVAHDWCGAGPLRRSETVAIPKGASVVSAAMVLERAGAIRSARRFRLWAKLFGGTGAIRAGEYRIPARLSQTQILKLLQGGRTFQRFVTVPEGWPSVLVQHALAEETELRGPAPLPAEGSVLPDSYSFSQAEPRAAVVVRMRRAMDKYLAVAWARRRPGIAVATPREALILASIVEKETGKPAERREVAAVYGNRLKRGMMLQADPTIIYPITHGKPLGRRILKSEVHARNAYNTYAMTGLPAGPICNPGRASIDAVLDPARSDALYFVADGTGGHVFATTLEQHDANVKRWFALRRARGEM